MSNSSNDSNTEECQIAAPRPKKDTHHCPDRDEGQCRIKKWRPALQPWCKTHQGYCTRHDSVFALEWQRCVKCKADEKKVAALEYEVERKELQRKREEDKATASKAKINDAKKFWERDHGIRMSKTQKALTEAALAEPKQIRAGNKQGANPIKELINTVVVNRKKRV